MKQKREVNYQGLFVLGMAFIPIGIATSNPVFIALGGLFFIISMAHRKKEAEQDT